MKTKYLIQLVTFFTLLTSLSSCSVIGGIFKTGMGVGVILVILVIGLIIYLVTRSSKK